MKWAVIYGLAAIGAFTVSVFVFIVLLAVAARHAEKRRRRRSQDALAAQYIREGSPHLLADDKTLFTRWAKAHGLGRLETPKGWRR